MACAVLWAGTGQPARVQLGTLTLAEVRKPRKKFWRYGLVSVWLLTSLLSQDAGSTDNADQVPDRPTYHEL